MLFRPKPSALWNAIDQSLLIKSGYDLAAAVCAPVMAYGILNSYEGNLSLGTGIAMTMVGFFANTCAESFSNEQDTTIHGLAKSAVEESEREATSQIVATHLTAIQNDVFSCGLIIALGSIIVFSSEGLYRTAFGLSALLVCCKCINQTTRKTLSLKDALQFKPL